MYMLRKGTLNVMANTSNHYISASPVCDGLILLPDIMWKRHQSWGQNTLEVLIAIANIAP